MATLTLVLSHPQAVARFEAWAEPFLCERGYWGEESARRVQQEAARLGLHRLDIDHLTARIRELPSVQEAFAAAARKRPRELWYELATAPLLHLAVIIDNSDSAQPHAASIAAYAQALEEGVRSWGTVQFWAWEKPVPSRAAALEGNRRNASLFAPVWEKLETELATGAITQAVVLGAGRLFDLEDFTHHQALSCVRFVPLADGLTGATLAESRLEPADLLASLTAPSASCSIGAPGALPFWWDNPAFSWNGERLVSKPAATASPALFGMRSGWLCLSDSQPQVETADPSVSWRACPSAPSYPADASWEKTPFQADALPESVAQWRLSLKSAVGAQQISPCELLPTHNQGWLWISLMENNSSKGHFNVRFQHQAAGAVLLPEGDAVALSLREGVQIYRFHDGKWESQRLPQPYLKVREALYAFAL